MNSFRNILLAIDSGVKNPAALSCAFALAKKFSARLKVVTVVKETEGYQPILPESAMNINFRDLLIQEKKEYLEHLLRPFQEGQIETSVRILVGAPFLEIVREVIRDDHDLVIVTPEGKSEFKDMLFGTTAMHLMRKCPCPVWAIKHATAARFPKILAAVDPDPEKKENTSLNKKILEISSSLAEMFSSELHIAHVWDFPVRSTMIQKQLRDQIAEKLGRMHKSWFEQLVKAHVHTVSKTQVHLRRGKPEIQIPSLLREKNVALIVMGTVGRVGIPGLLIGNTAEKILYRINCSVLAVKPDGFVTPIKVKK